MILFFYINLLVVYKDFFLTIFNNVWYQRYIKYQIFISKLQLVFIPLIVIFGLLSIAYGNYFILTRPIPYEELPIYLHQYVSSIINIKK